MALFVAFILKDSITSQRNNLQELLIELPPYRLPSAKSCMEQYEIKNFYVKKQPPSNFRNIVNYGFFQYFQIKEMPKILT